MKRQEIPFRKSVSRWTNPYGKSHDWARTSPWLMSKPMKVIKWIFVVLIHCFSTEVDIGSWADWMERSRFFLSWTKPLIRHIWKAGSLKATLAYLESLYLVRLVDFTYWGSGIVICCDGHFVLITLSPSIERKWTRPCMKVNWCWKARFVSEIKWWTVFNYLHANEFLIPRNNFSFLRLCMTVGRVLILANAKKTSKYVFQDLQELKVG